MSNDSSYTVIDSADSQQQSQALTFDVKRLLRLRLPLILLIGVIVAIPAAFMAWFSVTPVYVAEAEIRIMAVEPRVLHDPDRWTGSYNNFVQTQLNMIAGSTIASRAADEPEVRELDFVKNSGDPARAIQSTIGARMRGSSELASITCTMEDRQDAVVILEAVVQEYLTYAAEQETFEGDERLRVLFQERQARETELARLTEDIRDKRRELGAVTGEESATIYLENILETESAISQAESEAARLRVELSEIEGLIEQHRNAPSQPVPDYDIEQIVANDNYVAQLTSTIDSREMQLETSNLRPGAPQRAQREREVAGLRDRLNRRKIEVRSSALTALRQKVQEALASAEERQQEARARLVDLNRQLGEYEEMKEEEAELENELREIQKNADRTRSQLQEVENAISEIQLETKAPTRISLAAPVSAPSSPSQSKRVKLAGLAVFAALGFGFAVGVLRELTDQQVRSTQDVARLTNLPIIAALPHVQEEDISEDDHVAYLVSEKPTSRAAEEVRHIVSKIIYPTANSQELNSIAVVGAVRGDGKTTVACNVAIALSQAARKVLLVDAASRRPAVEKSFGLERTEGLAELLEGERDADRLIHQTQFENLYVMGPGLRTQSLATQLASRDMIEFLREAEEQFDHIVIDTPPLLLMSEAKLVTPLTDGAIFVASAKGATLGMIRRALRELEQADVDVVGVVLNKLRRMRGGYLQENMRRYKEYADQEEHVACEPAEPMPDMEVVEEDEEEDAEEVEVVMQPASDGAESTSEEKKTRA
jgi:capsular exopolysaccharide synthesis family protein